MSNAQGGPEDRDELVVALRQECDRLRTECDRLREQVEQVAKLVGSGDPARLLHDIRNIMNEIVLLRNLVDLEE